MHISTMVITVILLSVEIRKTGLLKRKMGEKKSQLEVEQREKMFLRDGGCRVNKAFMMGVYV